MDRMKKFVIPAAIAAAAGLAAVIALIVHKNEENTY